MIVIAISLLSLTCANAKDLGESDLSEVDSQDLEISQESGDVALAASDALPTGDAKLEMSVEADESIPALGEALPTGDAKLEMSMESGDFAHASGEVLSKSNSKTDSKSQAYIILDNDADIENIYIGDYVTWIVSVINEGPDTAKNVKVYDQLPDGLKYVKHALSKGTFDPETGIWSIGNLTIMDGELFLNITTQAFSVGEKINKAKVTSDTYNLNENESYEEEEIDVFEHEAKAYAEKSIVSGNAAGNPIALIVLSLFTILITSIKTK